ncbi:MAG: radical SAM/SPASM domain-containing protein [Thermodesulfobacteriota bacterium]
MNYQDLKREAIRRLRHLRAQALKSPSRKRRWRLLQVESAIACNLGCIMCPWKSHRESMSDSGLMRPEIWAAIRPHLAEVQSMDFTGGGEPLLQPKLAEWIAEAKSAGCETGFLTNGLLLKKERARELLDAGLDWVCFSLDGADKDMYEKIRPGSSFELVRGNLAGLAGLRRQRIPKIMINFVMMPANFHQIEEMVRLAGRLGADQVNFKQCAVIRGEHGKGLGLFHREESKETKRYRKELAKARGLARKMKIDTTAFSFLPAERPVCEQDPRDEMFVRHDGCVAPCINLAIGGATTFLGREATMPTVHYGRLPDRDLQALWESEVGRSYRRVFQDRHKAYQETFYGGLLSDSRRTPERLLEEALKRMPAAPEGCSVCHYLYDI